MINNIRLIIPIMYESKFVPDLFSKLTDLGYTWSNGERIILGNYIKNIAYIAIYLSDNIAKWGSHLEKVLSISSGLGYNYVLKSNNPDYIISVLKYLKQIKFLSDEDTFNFLCQHDYFLNCIKTL